MRLDRLPFHRVLGRPFTFSSCPWPSVYFFFVLLATRSLFDRVLGRLLFDRVLGRPLSFSSCVLTVFLFIVSSDVRLFINRLLGRPFCLLSL